MMELSRLAETTPRDRLLDPATPQGNRLSPSSTHLRRRRRTCRVQILGTAVHYR